MASSARRALGFAIAFGGAVIGCSSADTTERPGSSKAGAGGGASSSGSVSSGGGAGDARFAFIDASGAAVTELRYGEAFTVRLEGIAPGARVTITSDLWGYEGWAQFVAGATGIIDTAIDAPVDGTYDGVEPEGLVWSMAKKDDTQGATFDVAFRAEIAGAGVAAGTLQRRGLDVGLVSETISASGLVGKLYKPAAATKPMPALIVLGGSEGGIDTASFGAAWFAGYGYVALGLAYFGVPGLPAELAEIPLEYFATALSLLAARADVDPNRIGVVGGSRGGELALLLGAEFPQVHAVIAEVPSGVRWASVNSEALAAWTLGGAAVPYLTMPPDAAATTEALPGGKTGIRLTPAFNTALDEAAPDALASATTLVEQTQGPILLLGGADDGVWPSCRFVSMAMDRLASTGHTADNEDAGACYDGAGHFVPFPGWPTTGSYAVERDGMTLILGGTPKGLAHAERDGLTKARALLDGAFGP